MACILECDGLGLEKAEPSLGPLKLNERSKQLLTSVCFSESGVKSRLKNKQKEGDGVSFSVCATLSHPAPSKTQSREGRSQPFIVTER